MTEAKVFIKYTHLPGIVNRGITRADFRALGIDHADVWFTKENRYTVDAAGMPDNVIAVFAEDSDFSVGVNDSPPRLLTGEKYDAVKSDEKAAEEKKAQP